MISIKTWVVKELKRRILAKYPIVRSDGTSEKRKVYSNYKDDSSTMRSWNRWIQISTPFQSRDAVHYEYNGDGYFELHFEKGDKGVYQYDVKSVLRFLRTRTKDDSRIEWYNRDKCYLVRNKDFYEDEGKIVEAFAEMSAIFDPLLEEYNSIISKRQAVQNISEEDHAELMVGQTCSDQEVLIRELPLEQIFHADLRIPAYQRIYCWTDRNIKELWDDLCSLNGESKYHLGTIIVQRQTDASGNGFHNIIDGQQRLVTLTLMLARVGSGKCPLPLFRQKFVSQDAINNVGNAKYVIEQLYIRDWNKISHVWDNIHENLTFSVLIINSENLDLAYTFFANQNSGGVKLSDFDILKAHHLRYIGAVEQQAHMAERWNNLLRERVAKEISSNPVESTFLSASLGTHIYRLRKWMRKNSLSTGNPRPIRDEFQAALYLPEIPTFGERFEFNEKIEGGAHFFAYAEKFTNLFRLFLNTEQVKLLQRHLSSNGAHGKFETAIESLLFAYYIKFGEQYLSEALYCITNIMAQLRYDADRLSNASVLDYARNSEMVLMIDQASSPSFFLAEALSNIKRAFDIVDDDQNIKVSFNQSLGRIFKSMMHPEKEALPRSLQITDSRIKQLIENEY